LPLVNYFEIFLNSYPPQDQCERDFLTITPETMLYLLWALVNVALFIFLILGGIKAVKLIRQKFGIVTAIILVFCFLSIVFASTKEDNLNNQPPGSHSWNFNASESIEQYSKKFATVALENHFLSKYGLDLVYGVSKQEQRNVPVSANSFTIGLVSGTKWTPTSIIISPTDDNKKFNYEVHGDEDWKLLGFVIFSHSKHFVGTAELK